MSIATWAQFLAMVVIPAGLAMAAMGLVGWKDFRRRRVGGATVPPDQSGTTLPDRSGTTVPDRSRLIQAARWILLAGAAVSLIGGLVAVPVVGLCLAGYVATYGNPRIAAAPLALSALFMAAIPRVVGPMLTPQTQDELETITMTGGLWWIGVTIFFAIPALISAVLMAAESVRKPSDDRQLAHTRS